MFAWKGKFLAVDGKSIRETVIRQGWNDDVRTREKVHESST
jgi:hypothetical protein